MAATAWQTLLEQADAASRQHDDLTAQADAARCPLIEQTTGKRCLLDGGHLGDHDPDIDFTWGTEQPVSTP